MNTRMRPSRVLRKLREGGVTSCVKINLADPRVIEVAALAGFDCVWADLEHVPNSVKDIENQIRAAKMHDVDMVVRVPRGSYSDLVRPLEMDAAGVMIPHVMSAEDAKTIVRQSRFHPIGRRPLDGGNADGVYGVIPIEQYIEQSNHERFVILQIEDPEPLDELDTIVQLEGVDILFFGPGDFAHSLGVPGRFDDPRIADAQRLVVEAAQRHGKTAGTVGTIERLPELIEQGYRFISVGADVVGLMSYFTNIAGHFRGTSSGRAGEKDRPY